MTTKAKTANAITPAILTEAGKKAFTYSESRALFVDYLASTLGPKPTLEAFDKVRHVVVCGIMASSLVRGKEAGNPFAAMKTEAALKHCDERLTKYQGYGGLAPVREGMKGRRTEQEEKAYTNGRTQWHNLIKEAGVTVPDGKSGGSNNTGGAAGKSGNAGKTGGATTPKAEPEVAAKGKVSDVVPTPKFSTEKQAVAWAKREAAAMLATINGSAGKVPSWLKSAVSDFHAAVKKQTAAEKPVVAAK